MEFILGHVYKLVRYFEVKAQEYEREKDKPEKKRYWQIKKQSFQPLKAPDEEIIEDDCGKNAVLEAAKTGMKEGVLTGVFVGGCYGIYKFMTENIDNILRSLSEREGETKTTGPGSGGRGFADGESSRLGKRNEADHNNIIPENTKTRRHQNESKEIRLKGDSKGKSEKFPNEESTQYYYIGHPNFSNHNPYVAYAFMQAFDARSEHSLNDDGEDKKRKKSGSASSMKSKKDTSKSPEKSTSAPQEGSTSAETGKHASERKASKMSHHDPSTPKSLDKTSAVNSATSEKKITKQDSEPTHDETGKKIPPKPKTKPVTNSNTESKKTQDTPPAGTQSKNPSLTQSKKSIVATTPEKTSDNKVSSPGHQNRQGSEVLATQRKKSPSSATEKPQSRQASQSSATPVAKTTSSGVEKKTSLGVEKTTSSGVEKTSSGVEKTTSSGVEKTTSSGVEKTEARAHSPQNTTTGKQSPSSNLKKGSSMERHEKHEPEKQPSSPSRQQRQSSEFSVQSQRKKSPSSTTVKPEHQPSSPNKLQNKPPSQTSEAAKDTGTPIPVSGKIENQAVFPAQVESKLISEMSALKTASGLTEQKTESDKKIISSQANAKRVSHGSDVQSLTASALLKESLNDIIPTESKLPQSLIDESKLPPEDVSDKKKKDSSHKELFKQYSESMPPTAEPTRIQTPEVSNISEIGSARSGAIVPVKGESHVVDKPSQPALEEPALGMIAVKENKIMGKKPDSLRESETFVVGEKKLSEIINEKKLSTEVESPKPRKPSRLSVMEKEEEISLGKSNKSSIIKLLAPSSESSQPVKIIEPDVGRPRSNVLSVFNENVIIYSACNCALVLGIVCSIICSARASLKI